MDILAEITQLRAEVAQMRAELMQLCRDVRALTAYPAQILSLQLQLQRGQITQAQHDRYLLDHAKTYANARPG